ncbi:TonB-dependent siderophore receptor [Fulvivirga sp. M361]|uniref:TonB-dependent receptor plug domain-containing protein n=1 Tax=Fulvivirga sp. M361 TaxID=2594266 RepID=UPI0016280E39|nr:TonB-dependent receptor [Fulvivirga sp. M361]
MKTRLYFFMIAWCILSITAAFGQQIKVLDKHGVPIPNVVIFNKARETSILTNMEGKADISIFENTEALHFQHPSYRDLTVIKSQVPNDVVTLEDLIIEMQSVVVSANKWEQDISEIPNRILSIKARQVAYHNPQTSADLLATSGEVFVQKSQLGGGSPKLRGFSANSTLIVVDGVRMNNAIYRSGNFQNVISVDPNALEGTEVIMGPGSVIYGSDALGGVMDFHVQDPQFATNKSILVMGNTLLRGSTATNEKTGHLDLKIGGGKLASFSSFSFSSFDDLRSGSNRPDDYPEFGKRNSFVDQAANGTDILIPNDKPENQVPSGFDSWNIIQKFAYRPSKELNLSYGFYWSNTTDIPRYDALTEPVTGTDLLTNAEWYYGPQRWGMHALRVEYTSPRKLFHQAKLVAAYQDYRESRNDRSFGSPRLRTRTEDVDLYSVNLDFDKPIGIHSLFYGGEFLYNDVQSKGIRKDLNTLEITNTSSRYPDGGSDYYSTALYSSYTHRLEKFILSGGMRFTNVRLTATTRNQEATFIDAGKIDLNNSALNGSLGIVYKGLKDQKLGLLFSSGFRAPNVDDVGKVFELNDNTIIVPNENLKPEFSYNTEVSWSKNSDTFSWRLTGFITFLDNAIVRGDFTVNGQDSVLTDGINRKVLAQVNASEAIIYGGSIQLDWNISTHWASSLSITETAGNDRTNDQPLRHTTPVFGRWSVIYQKDALRAEFFSEFNGPRLRDDIPDNEIVDKPYLYARHRTDQSKDGSPGWYTLNISGAYELNKTFLITAALENILDRHYRPYSSGISAPGRNFILSVRASIADNNK